MRLRRGVGLAEDVGGADDGVLDVGAGLAFEAEGVFEVEGDDGVAGEAEHEVAEGADGDLRGDDRGGRDGSSSGWRVSTSDLAAAMS